MTKFQGTILIIVVSLVVVMMALTSGTEPETRPTFTIPSTIPMTAEEYADLSSEEKVVEIDAAIARLEEIIGGTK